VSRILTAARATVKADRREAYLATIAALAERLAARGQQFWVFEQREAPGEFLEFAEGSDDASHRAAGPVGPEEADLEAQLQRLATYHAERDLRWDAVPLASPDGEG
jgi:hypothetical protein